MKKLTVIIFLMLLLTSCNNQKEIKHDETVQFIIPTKTTDIFDETTGVDITDANTTAFSFSVGIDTTEETTQNIETTSDTTTSVTTEYVTPDQTTQRKSETVSPAVTTKAQTTTRAEALASIVTSEKLQQLQKSNLQKKHRSPSLLKQKKPQGLRKLLYPYLNPHTICPLTLRKSRMS